MVMTLRKRSAPPPPPNLPSYSSASDDEETQTRTRSITKKSRLTKSSGEENEKPNEIDSDSSDSDSESENENEYEKCREQRIKENKERMLKFGIFSLSSQFHGAKRPLIKKKKPPPLYPRVRSYDYRRSDRVSNGKAIETERTLRDMGIMIPEEWKTEVYSEKDEKLLGSCETEWTLNVDGFGEDGERLYDPVNGTSCHQCRQKTIRKHTYCGNCRLPQGQICGDCLYTRYGENVVETTENSDWMCPACRGICNCSRCRRAKGWPPVNILYSKVTESGFKSVAHYLILNRCPGGMPKESVDGTEGDTQAPLRYEGSDTSAEWAESDEDDSDDDDSKTKTRNADKPVGDAEPSSEVAVTAYESQGLNEPSSEAAVSADENRGLNEPTFH